MQPSLDLLAASRTSYKPRPHARLSKAPTIRWPRWLASGTRRGFTLLLRPKQRTGFFLAAFQRSSAPYATLAPPDAGMYPQVNDVASGQRPPNSYKL